MPRLSGYTSERTQLLTGLIDQILQEPPEGLVRRRVDMVVSSECISGYPNVNSFSIERLPKTAARIVAAEIYVPGLPVHGGIPTRYEGTLFDDGFHSSVSSYPHPNIIQQVRREACDIAGDTQRLGVLADILRNAVDRAIDQCINTEPGFLERKVEAPSIETFIEALQVITGKAQ
jgi:hypothetical protein